MNEWEAICHAWDRDYRRIHRAVLLSTADRCQALEAAIDGADHAADIRAQLVFREVDGWWDWEAGPYCSRSAYRTEAEAEANFEAVLIKVLEP